VLAGGTKPFQPDAKPGQAKADGPVRVASGLARIRYTLSYVIRDS
jgi:hypothetical protein